MKLLLLLSLLLLSATATSSSSSSSSSARHGRRQGRRQGRRHGLRHPFMRAAPLRCPIDSENTLRIQLFVEDEEECFQLCEGTDGCHFYR